MRSLEETNQYIDNDIDIIYKLRGKRILHKTIQTKSFWKVSYFKTKQRKYKIY